MTRIYDTWAWQQARTATKIRDGYRCTVCGTTDRLDVDHIIPVGRGGAPFDLANLRTICRLHHN